MSHPPHAAGDNPARRVATHGECRAAVCPRESGSAPVPLLRHPGRNGAKRSGEPGSPRGVAPVARGPGSALRSGRGDGGMAVSMSRNPEPQALQRIRSRSGPAIERMSRSARRPATTVQVIQESVQKNTVSASHVFSRLPQGLPVPLVRLLLGERFCTIQDAFDILRQSGRTMRRAGFRIPARQDEIPCRGY